MEPRGGQGSGETGNCSAAWLQKSPVATGGRVGPYPLHKDDPMDIEKALHNLILKMQRRDVDWQSVEETGVGLIFRQLSSFHGDGDIRSLARKAVLEATKLQHADAIR
eukprot:Skav225024  [mRNA]  locus=scaffold2061:16126:19134:+ [translate_table: standard]